MPRNPLEIQQSLNSVLRFRRTLAVLLCVASRRVAHPIWKSAARPSTFCVQFPHVSATERSAFRSDCSPLVPYYASDISIGAEEVAEVQEWYDLSASCSSESQQRIDKGAHFLNRAMNADDIEAFINYFVALDALFGERGSVEASILSGVQAVQAREDLQEKAPWLFDLRNELVHGGSRYISEWPKYTRYVQHFRTKPEVDIATLAQVAVLSAPKVLGAGK